MLRMTCAVVAPLMLCAAPVSLLAAGEPTAQGVLFDARHLDQISKGAEVTYRFERKVSDEAILGKPFSDEIKLGVTQINDKGEREVVIKIFTGEYARDPFNLPELTVNPLFHWYFDRSVRTYSQLTSASVPYLHAKFRAALRDKAQIESIKFDYNGHSIDAYRVSVSPFAGDPNASKMDGFDGSHFTMVVSNDAPGYILDMVAYFESRKAGAPHLEEHISLVGMGDAK